MSRNAPLSRQPARVWGESDPRRRGMSRAGACLGLVGRRKVERYFWYSPTVRARWSVECRRLKPIHLIRSTSRSGSFSLLTIFLTACGVLPRRRDTACKLFPSKMRNRTCSISSWLHGGATFRLVVCGANNIALLFRRSRRDTGFGTREAVWAGKSWQSGLLAPHHSSGWL